jgi:hypothetical protein
MHVDQAGRHYTTMGGERRSYPTYLLRRSYRDEQGRPRKETLANLTGLPPESIEALRATLKGRTLVDAEAEFEAERSVPHGDAAAAHVMAARLGLRDLLGPACAERDIAYALVVSRAVRPAPKLATARWWAGGDTTLGADLGVAAASTDEVYAAMDWLTARQRQIEAKLAARHLAAGGIAMFDLSSSWVEGSCCELAAFGHSRDGKRGRRQIEYGLLTDPVGRPVAVEVLAGNTADPESFKTAVTRIRGDFGIERLIMVGDRGMITGTRIEDLRKLPGMGWVTALKAPAIAKLAADDGPLQMSLFDVHNFAEITHPDYPGERLVCCHNPVLQADRARTRAELLADTEAELAKIKASVSPGQLKDPDKIGIRVGKVINTRKVAKHFILDIGPGRLAWRRDEEKIAAEAALDGIYVIRTSVPAGILDAAGAVAAYKNLKHVERDFRITKADDLDLRPIHRPAHPPGQRPRRPRPAVRPGQSQRRSEAQRRWPARLPLPRPARPPGHPRPADHHLRRAADPEAHHPHARPAPRLRTTRHHSAAGHHVASNSLATRQPGTPTPQISTPLPTIKINQVRPRAAGERDCYGSRVVRDHPDVRPGVRRSLQPSRVVRRRGLPRHLMA